MGQSSFRTEQILVVIYHNGLRARIGSPIKLIDALQLFPYLQFKGGSALFNLTLFFFLSASVVLTRTIFVFG